jgi:uncharacterized membrane protein
MEQRDAPIAASGTGTSGDALPAHAGTSIDAIARMHAQHEDHASPAQRMIEHLIRAVATPASCLVITLALLAGTAWHVAWQIGAPVTDPRNFMWIDAFGTYAALLMTALILATQRRADEFADARERLMLELALVSEQKTAKIIELLEQLRRDHPAIGDHVDHQANAMARPIDPDALFDAVGADLTNNQKQGKT